MIGYIRSNGLDADGNEIHSSIFFANTKEFQAGSRFKYMPKVIKDFTAENLQAAIKEAVEKEEAESGVGSITFEQKQEIEKKEKISFDELMEKIGDMGGKFAEAGKMEELLSVVEDILGTGKKVSECTPKQYEAVETIYDGLLDRAKELGIEV